MRIIVFRLSMFSYNLRKKKIETISIDILFFVRAALRDLALRNKLRATRLRPNLTR